MTTVEVEKKEVERGHLMLDSILKSPFSSSGAAASNGNNNQSFTSPFALPTKQQQVSVLTASGSGLSATTTRPIQKLDFQSPCVDPNMLAYAIKESVSNSTKMNPYEKLVNRKRRMRKGKVVHGRKEKQCDWCKTTETPEWRTGPQFSTLCNACGLQFRKFTRQEEEQENRGRNAIRNVLNEHGQAHA